MALLDWFRTPPETRRQRATESIAAGRFSEALDHLGALDDPQSNDLREQVENQLCKVNLDLAVTWAEAGEPEKVRTHVELAEELHRGGLDAELREAKARIRELLAAFREKAQLLRAAKEPKPEAHDVSLFHRSMGSSPAPMNELLAPDDEENRARIALHFEGYPEALRKEALDLGPDFARAVLDLDDGRPDVALQSLLLLTDDRAPVRFERARALVALGDRTAARRELAAFAALAHGHHPIGPFHTGTALAELQHADGDVEGALRVLREVRSVDPRVGGLLFAQLLEKTGALPEAETVLREVARLNPREPRVYMALARVRIAGGYRVEAMQALEQGLRSCCAAGTCSAQEPDVDIQRALATLYFEEGVDRARAIELYDGLRDAAPEASKSWDDVYVDALAAKAAGDPRGSDLARSLWDQTPPGPARERLQRYLPVS